MNVSNSLEASPQCAISHHSINSFNCPICGKGVVYTWDTGFFSPMAQHMMGHGMLPYFLTATEKLGGDKDKWLDAYKNYYVTQLMGEL